MGVNSGLKDKKSSVVYEARRSAKSKTSSKSTSEVQSEVDSSPVRPKSSPISQFKSLGKIPRLRPRTAIPSPLDDTQPEVDQIKTKRKLADKWPTGRTTLIPPPKKYEFNHIYAATETSIVKDKVEKVDEKNIKSENLDGCLAENLPGKNPCYTIKNNSIREINSASEEPNLNATNFTSKLRDPRKKTNETPKAIPDANQSENSPKKTSQDFQKVNQATKTKFRDPDPMKKKAIPEKIKEALKEDFSSILPIYQSEMKKIQDVWVTTIYSSLTMRSHLVKLLIDAFPNLNLAQFQTENDQLFKSTGQVEEYTETEKENLYEFIKSLLKSQNSVKEENEAIVEEKKIASLYSNDWSLMTKKLGELAEETRKLQIAIPEEEKKKGLYEKKMKEKIRETELVLVKKEKEINKLISQLNSLKQKELSFRGSVITKLENFNDIQENIESLKAIEQEYKKMKSSYMKQNETYKEKIDSLQCLFQDKTNILKKQRKIKNQMQSILEQVQAQKSRQCKSKIEKEMGQVDYFLKRLQSGNEKAREQVWVAAVKLILKGFWTQIEKLEFQKNRMLLELQTSDFENLKSTTANLLTINKKQNQLNDRLTEIVQQL